MSIRVMAWNIKDFGSNGKTYTKQCDPQSRLLTQFVAGVVMENDIDVLAVMEVYESAEPSLSNLLFALNVLSRDTERWWCYDWIPGALEITGQNATPAAVTSVADLTWQSGLTTPRREGYAVFWRCDLNRFRMLETVKSISCGTKYEAKRKPEYLPNYALSLSLSGREIEVVGHKAAPRANFDPDQPANGWESSYYPEVSTQVDIYNLNWERVRRPVDFVLQLPGADQQRTVWPIQIYHAPSTQSLAQLGVFVAALGQELYTVGAVPNNQPSGALIYHDKSAALGDYNLNSADANLWGNIYYYYYAPFDLSGGQHTESLSSDRSANPTEVKLTNWPDHHPILAPDVNSYYGRAIDNVFIRKLRPGFLAYERLLEGVMTHGRYKGALVSRFLPLLEKARKDADAIYSDVGPCLNGDPLFPEIYNWDCFFYGVRQGYFDGASYNTGTGGARSAAQFIRKFVSDHLPVWLEFTS